MEHALETDRPNQRQCQEFNASVIRHLPFIPGTQMQGWIENPAGLIEQLYHALHPIVDLMKDPVVPPGYSLINHEKTHPWQFNDDALQLGDWDALQEWERHHTPRNRYPANAVLCGHLVGTITPKYHFFIPKSWPRTQTFFFWGTTFHNKADESPDPKECKAGIIYESGKRKWEAVCAAVSIAKNMIQRGEGKIVFIQYPEGEK